MLTLRCHVFLYNTAMVCMCLGERHSYLFLIKPPLSCGTTYLCDLLLLFNVLNQVMQKKKKSASVFSVAVKLSLLKCFFNVVTLKHYTF